jgi:hypothetical protein
MLVKNATERDLTVRYSLNLFSEGKIAKINLDDLSLQRMENHLKLQQLTMWKK